MTYQRSVLKTVMAPARVAREGLGRSSGSLTMSTTIGTVMATQLEDCRDHRPLDERYSVGSVITQTFMLKTAATRKGAQSASVRSCGTNRSVTTCMLKRGPRPCCRWPGSPGSGGGRTPRASTPLPDVKEVGVDKVEEDGKADEDDPPGRAADQEGRVEDRLEVVSVV